MIINAEELENLISEKNKGLELTADTAKYATEAYWECEQDYTEEYYEKMVKFAKCSEVIEQGSNPSNIKGYKYIYAIAGDVNASDVDVIIFVTNEKELFNQVEYF